MFQAFGLFSVHCRRPRSQGVSHRVAIPAAKSQRGYGIRGPTRTLLSGTYTFDTSFAGPDRASPCQSQDLGCPAITKSADRPFRARNLPGNQIAASRIGSVGGLLESATYIESPAALTANAGLKVALANDFIHEWLGSLVRGRGPPHF